MNRLKHRQDIEARVMHKIAGTTPAQLEEYSEFDQAILLDGATLPSNLMEKALDIRANWPTKRKIRFFLRHGWW